MLQDLKDNDRVDVAAWHALGVEILKKHGVDEKPAAIVASVLVEADKRGVASHGVARLPSYIKRVQMGLLQPNARPQIVKDGQTLMLLDGCNGFGAVAGVEAAELAATRAAELGMCWVSVRNNNHIGMLGYYSQLLAQRSLVGIVMCNASPAVAAYGGKRAVLGTNPLSIAVPGDGEPIVLDMATTTVARGKIRRAAAEGKSIAPGLALDFDGNPTTDAAAALKGTLASLGGPKGYGLAVMIELMSGLVSGGKFLTDVKQATDLTGTAGQCFTIIAAAIGRISDRETYADRLNTARSIIRNSGHPDATIYLPGEIESRHATVAEKNGIAVPRDVLESLEALL